jgi:predicted RNA-binding Zn-ribbon protein involved in translation (DUF1610 family)
MIGTQAMLETFYRHAHKLRATRYHCPGCGRNIKRSADACPQCGADIRLRPKPVSHVYQCSGCGRIVGVDAIACNNAACGADLR